MSNKSDFSCILLPSIAFNIVSHNSTIKCQQIVVEGRTKVNELDWETFFRD